MTTMDVAKMRADVVSFIAAKGFVPRDADGTDFEHKDASFPARLRFKVGTSRGEVAVVPVIDGRGGRVPIRILSAAGFESAKTTMTQIIDSFGDARVWKNGRLIDPSVTGMLCVHGVERAAVDTEATRSGRKRWISDREYVIEAADDGVTSDMWCSSCNHANPEFAGR